MQRKGLGLILRSSRFFDLINLYSCMLSCLFSTLIKGDMARRGWDNDRVLLAVSLVPVFGLLVYLVVRPLLPESFHSLPNSGRHEVGARGQ